MSFDKNAYQGGTFFIEGNFNMLSYSKTYLSPADLIQNLMAKGMVISSVPIAEEKIKQIGYYRLKGYFYTFYDVSRNSYINTKFDDILSRTARASS